MLPLDAMLSWSVPLPGTMLMSVGHAAAKGHVGIHGPCCRGVDVWKSGQSATGDHAEICVSCCC